MAALALTAVCTNVAKAGYLYVSTTDWTPTTGASVNLPINAQSGVTIGEHSLFEIAMQNDDSANVGNTIEVGITTDPGINGVEVPTGSCSHGLPARDKDTIQAPISSLTSATSGMPR